MIDNWYALACTYPNATQQKKEKKKCERSHGASIKPSMNQSRRHIIHPQWCGRLCGTELLNSVLIGACESKWDTCGRQEEKCIGPKKNFCFSYLC